VLATNLKRNLDSAFLRRLHFVIDFAMPHPVIATARELRKAGRLAQPRDFGEWGGEVVAHLVSDAPPS